MHVQRGRRLRGGYRASSSRLPIKSPTLHGRASKGHIVQRSHGLRRRKGARRGQRGAALAGPCPTCTCTPGPGDAGRARSGLLPRPQLLWSKASLSPCLPLAESPGGPVLTSLQRSRGATRLRGGGHPEVCPEPTSPPEPAPTVPGAGPPPSWAPGAWRSAERQGSTLRACSSTCRVCSEPPSQPLAATSETTACPADAPDPGLMEGNGGTALVLVNWASRVQQTPPPGVLQPSSGCSPYVLPSGLSISTGESEPGLLALCGDVPMAISSCLRPSCSHVTSTAPSPALRQGLRALCVPGEACKTLLCSVDRPLSAPSPRHCAHIESLPDTSFVLRLQVF